MSDVCFVEDDFVRELETDRRQALWVAELSDGRTAYMDDGRPSVSPPSAWERLRRHVEESEVGIRKMHLRFRSNHLEMLPEGADGYFFSKAVAGFWGCSDTLAFHLFGVLTGEKLVVHKVGVPELIWVETTYRDPEKAGPCLIRNPAHGTRKTD